MTSHEQWFLVAVVKIMGSIKLDHKEKPSCRLNQTGYFEILWAAQMFCYSTTSQWHAFLQLYRNCGYEAPLDRSTTNLGNFLNHRISVMHERQITLMNFLTIYRWTLWICLITNWYISNAYFCSTFFEKSFGELYQISMQKRREKTAWIGIGS